MTVYERFSEIRSPYKNQIQRIRSLYLFLKYPGQRPTE